MQPKNEEVPLALPRFCFQDGNCGGSAGDASVFLLRQRGRRREFRCRYGGGSDAATMSAGAWPVAKRFICIHGHFYQPPRENPWLETVETQESAAPYHDWNERITAECYATNGASRIVDKRNRIIRIVNNYARMSFNIGPTLLSWLSEMAPRVYRTVLDGERRSRDLYKGHSSALAQVYNHVILPLASERDRRTQIRWGIADYKTRFGRMPEGMWLAETAADTRTLEMLAEEGIRFTVLAPHQCRRVRAMNGGASEAAGAWRETPGTGTDNGVDPTRPYLVRFASGRSLAVFFYHGPVARAVAFEGLLNSGENLVARLKAGFRPGAEVQLMHIATDGESYGHHHKHGEMALSYALKLLDEDGSVGLANYGSYLAEFPPTMEAEIVDNSSWSCVHGVERWRSDCGCNGGRAGWNQKWRGPLREALDRVRDGVAELTEQLGKTLFRDVWAARDAYIGVILDRTTEGAFLKEHTAGELTHAQRVQALGLMEMQRHAQLMYTSCGWFFDDISGIETVQVIAYAARVLQLARAVSGEMTLQLEEAFLNRLREAKSNVPSEGTGETIYRERVAPMQTTLEQVAAHYAISAVYSSFADETELFCYRIRRLSEETLSSGNGRLTLGHVRLESTITGHAEEFTYAVMHFGDQNISAGVKNCAAGGEQELQTLTRELRAVMGRADFAEVIRQLDRNYELKYSLRSLFRDEQQRIVQVILRGTMKDIEASMTGIYEHHAGLMHYLSHAGLPKPQGLMLAAGFAVNVGLKRALDEETVEPARVRELLKMADEDGIDLDAAGLSYLADQRMKRTMVELQMSSGGLEPLERALTLARLLREMPFELNLWQAQNLWYEIFRSAEHGLTGHGLEDRPEWKRKFDELGELLGIACAEIAMDLPMAPVPGD